MDIDKEIERIYAEVAADLDFSDLTLREKSLKLISRKHYYVGILIRKKREAQILDRKKDDLMSKVKDQIKDAMIVQLSDAQIMKKAADTKTIREIDDQLKELKLVIEFLDHTVKNFSEASYIMKPVVDLMKLENE